MICPPLDEGTDGAEHGAGDGDGGSDRQATKDTLDPQRQYPCDNGGYADRYPRVIDAITTCQLKRGRACTR